MRNLLYETIMTITFGMVIGHTISSIRMSDQIRIFQQTVLTCQAHEDTLAKMVQEEQYQIDVLTQYVKKQ